MRRQRRTNYNQRKGEYHSPTIYEPILHNGLDGADDFLPMEGLPRSAPRFENTMEAKVEVGDTLQALALKFHCSVAEIKRLNKIDKDNEIHARKVIKIPVTVHTVLLGTSLPEVHTSGSSSPQHSPKNVEVEDKCRIIKNPLEEASAILSEKLMVASVNSSGTLTKRSGHSINEIILNSKVGNADVMYTDADDSRHTNTSIFDDTKTPLIETILGDDNVPRLRPIPGPSLRTIDWSGSDCDMSWVCLFIIILALCFVIPLVYVIYIAEHTHHHNTSHHIT